MPPVQPGASSCVQLTQTRLIGLSDHGRAETGSIPAAPRERFLPLDKLHLASVDAPISIGFGVTNSQPSTVAAMLESSDVHEGQPIWTLFRSGWTTALLAELVA